MEHLLVYFKNCKQNIDMNNLTNFNKTVVRYFMKIQKKRKDYNIMTIFVI